MSSQISITGGCKTFRSVYTQFPYSEITETDKGRNRYFSPGNNKELLSESFKECSRCSYSNSQSAAVCIWFASALAASLQAPAEPQQNKDR